MIELKWEFKDDCSQWTALSQIHDEGVPFAWRIDINEEAEFLVLNSDGELLNCESFPMTCLQDAKEWCQAGEDDLTSLLNPTRPGTIIF